MTRIARMGEGGRLTTNDSDITPKIATGEGGGAGQAETATIFAGNVIC